MLLHSIRADGTGTREGYTPTLYDIAFVVKEAKDQPYFHFEDGDCMVPIGNCILSSPVTWRGMDESKLRRYVPTGPAEIMLTHPKVQVSIVTSPGTRHTYWERVYRQRPRVTVGNLSVLMHPSSEVDPLTLAMFHEHVCYILKDARYKGFLR